MHALPTVHRRDDEAGVALYVALPMALLMIGGAWSILGFGDLILLRMHGQEAADAAAFSSAVTHAQGMNLIACLNIAMVALAGTYVAMRYLADIMNVILGVHRSGSNTREDLDAGRFRGMVLSTLGYQEADVISGACSGSDAAPYCADRSDVDKSSCVNHDKKYGTNGDGTEKSSCDVSKPLSAAFWKLAGGPTQADVNKKMLATFERNVVGEGLNAMSGLQFTLQRVQPMVASANAALIAEKQNLGGVGVGLSAALLQPQKSRFAQNGRVGLPVASLRPKTAFCDFFGRSAADVANQERARVPAPAAARVGAQLQIGRALRQNAGERFCIDRFLRVDSGTASRPAPSAYWSARDASTREFHGPMVLTTLLGGAIQNGGSGFQVFGAMTLRAKESMTDKAMAGLAQSQRIFRKGPRLQDTAPTTVRSYVAQAEFYLECGTGENDGTGKWSSSECSGGNMALFKMNWRARLRWMDEGEMKKVLSRRGQAEVDDWMSRAQDGITVSGPSGPATRIVPAGLAEHFMPDRGRYEFYH